VLAAAEAHVAVWYARDIDFIRPVELALVTVGGTDEQQQQQAAGTNDTVVDLDRLVDHPQPALAVAIALRLGRQFVDVKGPSVR
jgi:hypothetical protein